MQWFILLLFAVGKPLLPTSTASPSIRRPFDDSPEYVPPLVTQSARPAHPQPLPGTSGTRHHTISHPPRHAGG